MVRMGIVAEAAGETRVAATPTTVVKLIGLGYEVAVEAGAGRASSFPDAAYADAGARIVDRATAGGSAVVLKINPPTPDAVALLAAGATLIATPPQSPRADAPPSLPTPRP